MQDLGTLQPGGFSVAASIDATGQIVGYGQLPTGLYPGAIHGFLYANGVMSDMTDLGVPGYYEIYAYSMNAAGQIVGDAYDLRDPSWRYSAFLYTPVKGIVDLNTLLPSNSGWVLTDAHAINDAGQIIGAGTYEGQSTSFLLTMEPTVRPSPRPRFPVPREGDEPKQGPISPVVQR
jgi:probable HAF family extracellular repeat protein